MQDEIQIYIDSIEDKIIERRRDFHKFAESAWTEFRTASIIARKLMDLGYEVKVGKEVMSEEDRMGLPDEEVLEKHYKRALQQGADEEYIEKVKGGFTAVVGILDAGDGPTIALRFDIDALDISESNAENHLPYIEGFSSINENVMHACGHDGHGAIGIGVAQTLMEIKDRIKGKIKLIFQPAEEGVRGAKSITTSGVLDDVDYILAGHIGIKEDSLGELYCGVGGFLATSKFDAYFTGVASHAGGSPEKGRNALLAGATAALNLHAIPRHSEGATRINVGKLTAGTGRNVIPANACMMIETRGVTSSLNKYMKEQAIRVLEASAAMYNVHLEIKEMGGAESADSDSELIYKVKTLGENINGFNKVIDEKVNLGASEDFSYMMKRVQEHGGKAVYMLFGSDIKASHHNGKFDFDEGCLKNAVKIISILAYDILKK
ncbi:MAG: aminobenzoyl-glutamate utilization protein A [Clostridium sp.]|jgi:aminobenzoyl-glutamate utilization protein A